MNTTQSTIELFNLLFLQQLEKQMDKKLYALKGGCNLRFFFKSIRYSEDIDFDVTTIAKATLEKKVTNILTSNNFTKHCNNITYEEYKSQVVAYLMDSYQAHYGSPATWNNMQLTITNSLKAT